MKKELHVTENHGTSAAVTSPIKIVLWSTFFLSVSFLAVNFIFFKTRPIGVEDILAHRQAASPLIPPMAIDFAKALAGISLFSLLATYLIAAFRQTAGQKLTNANLPKINDEEVKKTLVKPQLTAEADSLSISQNLENDYQSLLNDYQNLSEEKRLLELETKKYEETIKNISHSEELMRRSNDALRLGYEKVIHEKEALILDLKKKDWELRELAAAPRPQAPAFKPAAKVTAGKSITEIKQRKAVEKLINEVDQMLFGDLQFEQSALPPVAERVVAAVKPVKDEKASSKTKNTRKVSSK